MKPKIDPTATVHPTAIIYDDVRIMAGAFIGPYCIIGAPPESKDHEGKTYGVYIGPKAILHGAVTVDAGTVRATVIGKGCYLMKQTHVGHDAHLYGDVIAAPHATIGGFAVIGSKANLGMNSVVHQRQTIGPCTMLGAGSVVVRGQDLEGYSTYVGAPARRVGDNKKYKPCE